MVALKVGTWGKGTIVKHSQPNKTDMCGTSKGKWYRNHTEIGAKMLHQKH